MATEFHQAGWRIGCITALVALLGGCEVSMKLNPPVATTTTPTSSGTAPTATAAPAAPKNRVTEYLPDSTIDSGAPKAPVVNIFGEFSKTRRSAVRAADLALRQHTTLDAGYDADATLDPAGRYLAFTSARGGDHTQIYRQPLEGGPPVQLTDSTGDDAQPTISPDGRRIAFASNRDGGWHIYIMTMDGGSVRQLTDGASNNMHPSFSPDGTRLVFASLPSHPGEATAGGQWELRTFDLVSGETKSIGFGLFPAWSPDKSRDVIAFQKTRARGSRWFSVWTCELKGGEATQITEVAVSSNAALLSPAWSPDGQNLAFASIVEPADTRRGKPQGQQDIWTMSADGSNRRRLTDGTATNLTPFWAVDNRVYFISDRSGHECIWSLPAGKEPADDIGAPTGEPSRNTAKRSSAPAIDESPAAANETAEINKQ